MRARELTGRPVLDVLEARELGRVESLVVDPENRKVVALRVRGADAPVLPLADVKALGSDAVTVEGADVIRQPSSDLEVRSIDGGLDPLGRLVLADDGTALGTVDDLEVEVDGTVRTIAVSGVDIAGDRLIGIGGYAVVVRAEPS